MKNQFWSKTKLGKWAAALILLYMALMFLKMFSLGISIRLPLPTPLIAVLGVIGFILGLVSFIKNKDRTWLTLLSIFVGLLTILWIAAEILFPH